MNTAQSKIINSLKMIVKSFIIASLFHPFNQIYAFGCSGKVSYLGIDFAGNVNLSVSSTPINKICSLEDNTLYSIKPPTCKAIYAALLSANALDKEVYVFYSDESYTCSNIPPWSPMPSAYYVQGPQ